MADTAPTLQGGGRRGYRIDAEMAAGGGLVQAPIAIQDSALSAGERILAGPTGPGHSGPGDPMFTLNARGQHAVMAGEPEVWQQQGSKLQPMGTMRRGNGNVTGGVPFLATAITAREGKGPDSDATTTLIGLGQITHALTAEGSDASEDGSGRGTPIVAFAEHGTGGTSSSSASPSLRTGTGGASTNVVTPPVMVGMGTNHGAPGNEGRDELATATATTGAAVRRLTPVECERLQGYPDGWTETSSGRFQADSARYRQLGNSIAVPVFAWVARRLARAHRESR